MTQGKFVDDPVAATREADELVSSVMRDRGYPVDEFEQRAADISVDHPQVAENYRAAHAVSLANERGLAGTDDLRQAFVHYRSLFAELLDSGRDNQVQVARRRAGGRASSLTRLSSMPTGTPRCAGTTQYCQGN